MANSPVFFVRNMPDYNAFIANPENLKDFFLSRLEPVQVAHQGRCLPENGCCHRPPASVLDPMYFSITPYKLGPRNIKFRGAALSPTRRAGAGHR